MFISSDRFDESILVSHDVTTKCEIVDPSGIHVVGELDVIAGNVSTDASRKTRRQCALSMQDQTGELVPNAVNDILQPYSGYSLRLWRGISWRDGTSELFPLGTFLPHNPRVNDLDDSLQINVDGYDRSKTISRMRWTMPYSVAAGTNTNTAIKAILDSRMSGLRYNIEPSAHTTTSLTFGLTADQNDPWADADSIASTDGKEVYFDARDIVTIRGIPDPDLDPVVAVYEEGENSTMTTISRENNGEVVYTGVIVIAEGSQLAAPFRVEVWRTDTDLRIPYFMFSPSISGQAQAQAAGEARLQQVGRAQYGVQVQCVPDPRLEVGDVVRIKRARSKIDDVFTVTSITMPLDAESEMSFTTSQRRITG